jgi:hypothetical protein
MVTPPSKMAFFPFNFIGGDLILYVFPSPKTPQMFLNNITSQISHIHPNHAPKTTTN